MKHRRFASTRKISLVMLILFFFVTGLLVFSTLWQYQQIKESTEAENYNFLEHQLNLVCDNLASINRYLFDTVTNHPNVAEAQTGSTQNIRNNAYRQMQSAIEYQSQFSNFSYTYLFYVNNALSVIGRGNSASYEEDEIVRKTLIDGISQGKFEKMQYRWRYDKIGDDYYLYQIYHSGDAYLCAWAKAGKVFRFFTENPSYHNASLVNTSVQTPPEEGAKTSTYYFSPSIIDGILAFSFVSRINIHQIAVVLLLYFLILSIFLSSYFYLLHYYRKYIETPLRNLRAGISSLVDTELTAPMHPHFSELEDANIALTMLKNQLAQFKIESYEKQLELAQTKLDYYHLQIKPHFFINCLNIIHSMIQKGDHDNAQAFCINLSQYFRYLFHNTLMLVPLKEEIKHLNLYLKIQNIRYRQNLYVEESVENDVQDALIPPLLLVTFVENSIKYSLRSSDDLVIDLQVSHILSNNAPYLSIMISDNGVGFSEEFMAQFQANQIQSFTASDGVHNIGIRNIYGRMSLLYHGDFELNLFNDHGAHILIKVPYLTESNSAEASSEMLMFKENDQEG